MWRKDKSTLFALLVGYIHSQQTISKPYPLASLCYANDPGANPMTFAKGGLQNGYYEHFCIIFYSEVG